jgi:hypothetical protein
MNRRLFLRRLASLAGLSLTAPLIWQSADAEDVVTVPEGECEIQCWDAEGNPEPCLDPCPIEGTPIPVYEDPLYEVDWSDPYVMADSVTYCYPAYLLYPDGSREYLEDYCTPFDYSGIGEPVTTLPATGVGS